LPRAPNPSPWGRTFTGLPRSIRYVVKPGRRGARPCAPTERRTKARLIPKTPRSAHVGAGPRACPAVLSSSVPGSAWDRTIRPAPPAFLRCGRRPTGTSSMTAAPDEAEPRRYDAPRPSLGTRARWPGLLSLVPPPISVTPAKAGVQSSATLSLDSCLRRNDGYLHTFPGSRARVPHSSAVRWWLWGTKSGLPFGPRLRLGPNYPAGSASLSSPRPPGPYSKK